MQVIQHLWRRRRVRTAGVLDRVAVDCPDDLAAIYRDYWELVYRRCQATLRDDEAAMDATQDVFEQALNNFDAIRHDVVRGLMDLARTISYERKRRPTREVSLADLELEGHPAPRIDDPAEIAERHRVLHTVWSGLSPVERRYVADKFAGFSFEEIARRNRRALGTVSSNLARAHEHARRMRDPVLPGVLALAVWRRLTELSRRTRNAAQNGSVAAAAQPVTSFTVSLTIAGVIAGAVPAAVSASSAMAPMGARALMVPTNSDGGATGTLQAGLAVAGGTPGTAAAAAGWQGASAGPAGGSLVQGDGLRGSPMVETPEDTEINAAAPSPNYDRDHTIVALGHGDTCNCRVLLVTTDGGATWSAHQGAPDGDQLVLPPTFPQDPTIFIGNKNGSGSTVDYWTRDGGKTYSSLQAPAGAITLPSGFDEGDKRVILATPEGVWAYAWPSGRLTPLLVEPATATPSATAPLSSSAGVFVMTSAQAFDPEAPVGTTPATSGLTLWTCPPGRRCTRTSTVPLTQQGWLAASPGFATDHTLVAFAIGQLVASTDSGSTFSAIGLPSSDASPRDVRLTAVPGGDEVWMTVSRAGGWALVTRSSLSAPWREADAGNRAIVSQPGEVVVVKAQRLLYLLAQGGLLCSVNAGVTWEARCPTA